MLPAPQKYFAEVSRIDRVVATKGYMSFSFTGVISILNSSVEKATIFHRKQQNCQLPAHFEWAHFSVITPMTTLSYNLYKMTMYNKKTSQYNKHTVTNKRSWDSMHHLSWGKLFHDCNLNKIY